jgi:hypothetical protein
MVPWYPTIYPTLRNSISEYIKLWEAIALRFSLQVPFLSTHQEGKMSVQKVALVTASSAGLGAQVARVLAPDFRVVSTPPSQITLQSSY